MNRFSRVATTAAVALATAVPATLGAGAATAAPSASTSAQVNVVDLQMKPRRKKVLSLEKAKPGTHFGLAGNKITARVKGKKRKGKVKFYLGGDLVDTVKLKKGKAKYVLPAELAPGTYKVKAKYKKAKASLKTVVWDSALNVNAAVFTISAATPSYELADLVGTVKYKGEVATTGWVDMYLNGNIKGGADSPDFCCMASVAEDGTFTFSSFLYEAQQRGVGTWTFRAFYTETSAFDDYIYSQPITVTVTP